MGGKRRKTTSASREAQAGLRAQGKGLVKRTQKSPFDPHGSDDVTYQVREIKAEGTRFGKPSWLIGWEGYGDAADSWEPIENLAGHEQDIAQFREKALVLTAEAEKRASQAKKRKASTLNDDVIAIDKAKGKIACVPSSRM